MIIPDKLNKGDVVAIISTARKISKQEVETAVKYLEAIGLEVKLGANIFEEDNQFAGTDEQRAKDLQWALNHPDVKAIFCSRGGYGTVRIIDNIDYTTFIKNPKWVCGYSDITALHSHLHAQFNATSIHSTMPINFKDNTEKSLASLKSALFDGVLEYRFESHAFNRVGRNTAKVVGGNLSMLYSLMGSSSEIDTEGKILFLEDLDEYLYHIDRMMMNLKRANKLNKLAGLIVGGMTDMNDNTIPFGKGAEKIIQDAVKEYNYPVCFNFPAGHIDDNRAIILGAEATIKVSSDAVVFTQNIASK